MPRGNKPRWTSTGVKDGIEHVHIRKYRYFIDYIYENFTNDSYIFRGHRKDTYKLESTLDRQIVNKLRILFSRESQLDTFKMAARGKRGTNPQQLNEPNEWWSLGQHHGLNTPLLDWTYSPFVAAYFAFFKTKGDDTKKRVIYALNKGKIETYLRIKKKDDVTFFQPTSDENPRVLNQNGLFTITKKGEELENWVHDNFAGETKHILYKIFIPNSEREKCLESLCTMNINHITLFPDIYGAAIYTNIKAELQL